MPEVLAALHDALGTRYQLGDELGRGGMATVYRARDLKHDRDVAIKVLPPDVAGLVGRERFLREISIASRLQHAHIVPLYDSGGEGDVVYYVMPLIQGESLRDRLDRETQLPLDEALAIARDVADGLGFAHSQGVVHRDIKPENILLSAGRAMVTDFGIARAIAEVEAERLTSHGIVPGTPPYMSPEQAAGSHLIDGRADLYALGCVMQEMLTGSPPFSGRTAQAILSQHISQAPPSVRATRPTIPVSVEQVVFKLLAKVPADRFGTATQMNAALSQASLGARTAAGPRRHGAVRGLVAAAALVAGYAGWRAFVRPAPLDPNKVVVYPLVTPGAANDDLGARIALLIGSALEHTEPLRFVDGWRLLDERTRGDPARLGIGAALRIARRGGAQWYVDGETVRSGDSLSIILRLTDARDNSVQARITESGLNAADAGVQLGLRALARLLPSLVGPSRHIDVSYLADRRPAAVADWLQGEKAYRNGQYDSAVTLYLRALAADSLLAVAALKAGQASTWNHYGAADSLVRIALRHSEALPARNRAFARGLVEYLAGHADASVEAFREALAGDSGWAEAWAGLGETYLHLIPSGVGMDSLAQDAFARSLRADPAFVPAAFHLAELTLRYGSRADAERQIGRFAQQVTGDSGRVGILRAMLACATDGPGAVAWPALTRIGVDGAFEVGLEMSAGHVWPACARSAFAAVLATPGIPDRQRWSAVIGLHHLMIAGGENRQALAFIDSLRAAGHRWPEALLILDGTLGVASRASVDSVLRPYLGPINAMSPGLLNFVGPWFRHLADTVRLDSVRRRYSALSTSPGDAAAIAGNAAEAWLALLRADTAAALSAFTALRSGADISLAAWRFWEPLAAERLQLAELLLARGRAGEALELAGEFDRALSINLVFLRPSLDLRARAASALGRQDLADRYHARIAAMGATARPNGKED